MIIKVLFPPSGGTLFPQRLPSLSEEGSLYICLDKCVNNLFRDMIGIKTNTAFSPQTEAYKEVAYKEVAAVKTAV